MKELWRCTDASATQEVKQLSDTRLNNKGYIEQSAFNKVRQIVALIFWLETLKKAKCKLWKEDFLFYVHFCFYFFILVAVKYGRKKKR